MTTQMAPPFKIRRCRPCSDPHSAGVAPVPSHAGGATRSARAAHLLHELVADGGDLPVLPLELGHPVSDQLQFGLQREQLLLMGLL